MSARRSALGAVGLVGAAVLLKFWLVAPQQLVVLGASHDDWLFVQLAEHLASGRWLGPYTPLTLAKGPGYPLWIAVNHFAGIPLFVANHALHLAACAAVVLALRPWLPGPWTLAALFLWLWWDPVTWDSPIYGRVIRQSIYGPLALLTFAAITALGLGPAHRRWSRVVWMLVAGLAAAAFWLTREEGVWLLPSLALLVALGFAQPWRRSSRPSALAVLGHAAPLLGVVLVACAAVHLVARQNARAYGWSGVVEFKAPAFVAAVGALQRVTPPDPQARVPVTRATRELIYAASPAFAELRPFFEGGLGQAWAVPSGIVTGRPPEDREIAAGWFLWSLRDAVRDAGHAPSADVALAFYARLAAEINAAVDAGLLPGGPRRDSLLPAWRAGDSAHALRAWHELIAESLKLAHVTAHQAPSQDDPALRPYFAALTHEPAAPARPDETTPTDPRLNLLENVLALYRVLVPALVALAPLLALWRLLRPRPVAWPPVPLLVALAAAGGWLALLAINALVNTLAFPSTGPGAFGPAMPLLLLALGLLLLPTRAATNHSTSP